MPRREPPTIDMRLDGTFQPDQRTAPPLALRIAGIALAVAVIAGILVLLGLVLWILFWVLTVLVPVAVIAGLIGWAAWKFQLWKSGHSLRGPRDLYRR